LDNIKHLYIYQHKNGETNCEINPLYPKDKKLIKKLQLPIDPDFKKLHYEVNRHDEINNKKFKNTVGLVGKNGPYESILLPNQSLRQKEIKKCAEYRITNTGKKFKGFTIWEFEKKDFKDHFIPLILWTGSELNELEKKIISKNIDQGTFGLYNQKKFQKEKYGALIKLIEKGDFGDYFEQKDKMTLNSLFDNLTKKSTKKFWERNFPKFNKLRQDPKDTSDLKKDIRIIIGNIIYELQRKDQTPTKKLKNLNKSQKLTRIFTIYKNKKPINLNEYDFAKDTDNITYYEKYFKEIIAWKNDVENIVKRYEA
jgi:hypothetical protein